MCEKELNGWIELAKPLSGLELKDWPEAGQIYIFKEENFPTWSVSTMGNIALGGDATWHGTCRTLELARVIAKYLLLKKVADKYEKEKL